MEWKKNKFKKSIDNYKIEQRPVKFKIDNKRIKQITTLLESASHKVDSDFYTMALETITP